MYLIKEYFLFLHKMSFHEYYHSLPTTILQDIYDRLYALGGGSGSGSGSGSGNNTEINKIIEKINIKLSNKPYHDEYFAPDFNIEHEDKYTMKEFITYVNTSSVDFLLIPFLNQHIISNIIILANGFDSATETKFMKTVQYYGNLIFFNVIQENIEYIAFKHYILFWLFNNVNLTKTYTSLEITPIKDKLYAELTNVVSDSLTILNNNGVDKKDMIKNLLSVIQESAPYPGGIMDGIVSIRQIIQTLQDESQRKSFILYINMCLCQGQLIYVDSSLPESMGGYTLEGNYYYFQGWIEDIFNAITNRFPWVTSSEDVINVFN
jgi:hypothetical protein